MTKHLCDVKGFRAALGDAMGVGMERFYRFYLEKPDYKRGVEIFSTQFVPFVEKYVENRGVSLDIGYGPGSMVYAASKMFNLALGVDVHLQNKEVSEEIAKHGCKNFRLYVGEGTNIPLADETVDFIHTWTVFMHLGKARNVSAYLKECYRVLRDRGVAVIYFARMNRQKPHETKEEWKESIEAEVDMYREKIKKVNQINLTISMEWMEWAAESVGFKILERTASTVAVHGVEYYHGQHGLVLEK